ncbi:Redoxin domain protein [Candidatus Ruthia magnifica str. Cm (Calyptogena magnifica)]|uniref:Redoxin domain protein n=1 Tax=Ruthia magnifica subsp. Calyptogena magnifica TaxID=413404 RepID=A1AVZ4_RUTMC|nr:TlpA disulfide reductase family protein [Candidatus Ruthturnera calyptogenae]ABL02101.1 Redoxin domain protein [Candidatus Ruthia magnifica str. Cm (Calyptogena magnifica)]
MTKNLIIPPRLAFQLGNKIAKIGFICSLFLAFNVAQAISIDDMWQKERKIKVPDFSLTDLNGNIHTNKSTLGKYLVVNFWATWCPPCLKEIPDFVKFYEKNKDKVLILGLDYEQAGKAAIIEFTDTFMVNYPIILFDDKNYAQFKKFDEILGMPTTYIYGPNGNLVDYQMGEMDMMALEKAISK